MSSLGSGTVKLMAGRIAAIAIGFGTAPIVYRIFVPEEAGAAAIVETIVLWVTAFSSLGYASAIPLSAGRGETRALIRLCFLLT